MIIWRKWLGIAGGIFPGGKEACLEQAERILKNSFVFQEHWEMERTHEAVVFGDKIEWDAVPFGDPEWLYALNRHTCFLILGKAWRYRCGEKDEAGRSKALEYGKKFVALLEDWLEMLRLLRKAGMGRGAVWKRGFGLSSGLKVWLCLITVLFLRRKSGKGWRFVCVSMRSICWR